MYPKLHNVGFQIRTGHSSPFFCTCFGGISWGKHVKQRNGEECTVLIWNPTFQTVSLNEPNNWFARHIKGRYVNANAIYTKHNLHGSRPHSAMISNHKHKQSPAPSMSKKCPVPLDLQKTKYKLFPECTPTNFTYHHWSSLLSNTRCCAALYPRTNPSLHASSSSSWSNWE